MLPGTLAYVLEDDIGVCGYVLATLDSKPFYTLLESEWLPKAAAMYPQPDEACTEESTNHSNRHRLSIVCSLGLPYVLYINSFHFLPTGYSTSLLDSRR